MKVTRGSLNTKKIIVLICTLAFFGCANLKKTHENTNTKVDSSSVVNIDATKFSKGLVLEPINLEKPILIGGKEYFNTKATFNTVTERIIYKDSVNKAKEVKKEVATKEKDYSVLIESFTNKLFILIIVLFVLFYLSKKFL